MTKPLFITGFSSWDAVTHSIVKRALLTPIFQDLYIKVTCQDFWVLMWFKTHFLMPARGREKANTAKALWHLREAPHWPRKSPECAYPPTQLLRDRHLLKSWVLVGQPLNQHIFGQLEYFTRVFICLTLWVSERSHKTTKLLLLLLLLCVNPTMLSRMKVTKPALFPNFHPLLRACTLSRAMVASRGAGPQSPRRKHPRSSFLNLVRLWGKTRKTKYTFSSTNNNTLWILPTGSQNEWGRRYISTYQTCFSY